MASRKAKKAKSTIQPSIELGEPVEESPPLENPLFLTTFSPTDSPPAEPQDIEEGRLVWNTGMTTALVEFVFDAWKQGKTSDNGMKKELWLAVSGEVTKVAGRLVTWDKCKNKWGSDIKEKWKHFSILSESSGFGWNEETEKFEAYDYVWENLNRSYPRIIWHKTHVMYHRELLSQILHESQATGKGAISGEDPEDLANLHLQIDPRLLDADLETALVTPRASLPPNSKPKPPYNRSKRRVKIELSDDEEETPALKKATLKKVDLGYAVASLTTEMAKSRELREAYKSDQQKAINLLEREYGKRLSLMAFIEGCAFFKDDGNAGIFLSITDKERRDRWLEINLSVELTGA